MRALIFVLLALAFYACEDKKKVAEPLSEAVEEKAVELQRVETVAIDTPAARYPLITDDNVVDFLTQYGAENPETKVEVETQHGKIVIQLYEDTPLHRANFIYLVKQAYFDGTFFHRVVPNFIIQGGNSDTRETPRKRSKLGKKYLIPAELENGRIHRYGTVSGAKDYRDNPDNKSVPFEFFIFLGPQSSTAHLNGNYTIFGRVIQGMEVVETIANLPHDEGDWPKQNVYISAGVLD